MKNAFLCFAIALLFAGCQKLEDYLPKKDKPNNQEGCLIHSITQNGFDDPIISTFYYNSKSLPDSILHSTGAATGLPAYHFRYNNKGQLTQFIQSFRYRPNNIYYDSWHLYQYNNKGQITSDTTYASGYSEPGTHPAEGTFEYEGVYYHTYTYDAQGRIIQVSTQGIGGDAYRGITYDTYTYDAAGNRELEGYTYSTAKNINRTSSIWQFLNRDYSVNSRTTPAQVAENNLPVRYGTGFNNDFLSIELMPSQIVYDCSKN